MTKTARVDATSSRGRDEKDRERISDFSAQGRSVQGGDKNKIVVYFEQTRWHSETTKRKEKKISSIYTYKVCIYIYVSLITIIIFVHMLRMWWN